MGTEHSDWTSCTGRARGRAQIRYRATTLQCPASHWKRPPFFFGLAFFLADLPPAKRKLTAQVSQMSREVQVGSWASSSSTAAREDADTAPSLHVQGRCNMHVWGIQAQGDEGAIAGAPGHLWSVSSALPSAAVAPEAAGPPSSAAGTMALRSGNDS